jgi:tetratricopeptide (TPR) repeat protein
MLNIQLIEADSDNHLWAGQFQREAKDIFKLQQEVAKTIAEQIQVFISPEEEARIDKIPTDNLEAYDYFLKGLDLMYTTDPANLHEAISLYKKAIDLDNSFARAYAGVAIAYYFLDAPQIEKQYSEEINNYADQALLFDPQLPQSLIAKALFYMNSMEYDLAVPYLEKALEYNPNSALVVNTLSDFYARYSPDTEKYLEYALKGIRLDIASHDSTTASFIYLHVSNAFIQSGFISEAEEYIKRSVAYDPDNLYSAYVRAYILYARNGDLRQLKDLLSETWMRDPSRLDVLQEVGKACYYMRDYEEAYHYYQKFVDAREAYSLDIYMAENAKIALVYSKMGLEEKSDSLLQDYKAYADNDHSIYKHLSLSMYYSVKGDVDQAIEHLRLFAKEDNYFYWTILFLEIDPLIDNIKDEPEFKMLMQELEAKFWDYHEDIRYSLEEKGLI